MAKNKQNQNGLIEGLDRIAFVSRVLSDENRLRILLCLADGKRSVSQIVEALDLSQPLVSHHLKELKRALLVTVERKGPFIYYEISDQRILQVLRQLNRIASDLLSNRTTF